MSKQFKIVIFANVLLSLVFILSNFFVWINVDQWVDWNIASEWSPILVAPYRIPDAPTVQTPVFPQLNLPFMLFWVMLAVNLYFIIKLQRNEKMQPT